MSEVGLPIGWRRASLATLASYVNGFAFNDQFWSEKGLPIVRIAQITGSQPVVDRFDGQLPSHYRLDDGDLIFSWSGTLAVVRWHGGPAWLNQHLFKVEPRGDVDRNFLFHLLQRSVAEMDKRSHGSTMKHIKRGELAEYEVVLPKDLNEQAALAKVLDTLDTTIRQTEAIIEKLKQVKQGLLHDLLTRGIDANGELRPPQSEAPHLYKASPLGWIPSTWTCEPLEKITSKIVDGVHHTPTYAPMGVPFVTIKNLTESEDISFKSLNYVSQRDHREFCKRADPKPGDVLVTKDGTLGVARLVRESHPEFSIFVSVAQIRPLRTRLSPQLLLAFFDSEHYRAQMGGLSGGSGLKHIHLEQFRRFDIPTPPLSEQNEICSGISAISNRISTEGRALEELRKLKSGLMDDLLTGRVRVTPLLTQPTTT